MHLEDHLIHTHNVFKRSDGFFESLAQAVEVRHELQVVILWKCD